jgi:phosphomannomutase
MVSVSGVRGVVGEGLTPEVALSFARAFAAWCEGGRVVLGRDSRVSGPLLHAAVTAGLLADGCEVVDLGIAPTPTTKLATERRGAAGGLILTASHNPIEWNGIKMLAADGLFLDEEQGRMVLDLRARQAFRRPAWSALGRVLPGDGATEDHVRAILALPWIDAGRIAAARFRVAVDCVNGAGAGVMAALLDRLGCEVTWLHAEANGRFPRNPEPLPENLAELGEAVGRAKAHVGLALDPDADRLAIVSERGAPLGEEHTLALAVQFLLPRRPGPLVVNLSTSMAVDDLAARHGLTVERTKVGEIHVAKRMRELGATAGGEGNGGVILPDVNLGRDAFVATALLLQHLAEAGVPLSELDATLPRYVMKRRKVELAPGSDARAMLQQLLDRYAGESPDTRDGVKILRDRSWVQVRASNTEPILRIMAEALDGATAEAHCEEMARALAGSS